MPETPDDGLLTDLGRRLVSSSLTDAAIGRFHNASGSEPAPVRPPNEVLAEVLTEIRGLSRVKSRGAAPQGGSFRAHGGWPPQDCAESRAP